MSKYPPLHSGRWYAERMGRNGRSVRKSYKPKYPRFYINPDFQDALGRFDPEKWEAEKKSVGLTDSGILI